MSQANFLKHKWTFTYTDTLHTHTQMLVHTDMRRNLYTQKLTQKSFDSNAEEHMYIYIYLCTYTYVSGQNMGYFPILGDGHQLIDRELNTHYKDSHQGMDDHTPYIIV